MKVNRQIKIEAGQKTLPRNYIYRLTIILTLALILTAGSFAADIDSVLGPAPGSYKILTDDGVIRIPFELFRGDIRFNGEINSRPVRMLLDNGYLWDQILFFGSPRVDSLNLEYDGEIDVGGSGDSDKVLSKMASGITVRFPGVEFYDQMAIITPYSSGISNMWWGAEGQVSAAFFKHFVVAFDFDKMILTLIEPEKFVYQGKGAEIPMKHEYNNSWSLPATIEFSDGRKIVLDLAMDLGYGDQLQIVTGGKHQLKLPEKVIPGSLGFGIQGETRGYYGRVKSVDIGGYKINDIVSGFTGPEHAETAFSEVMVGLGLLSRFNFIYDYPRHRMFVEPNQSFSEPFEYNMTGLSMRRGQGEYLEIMQVTPASPSEEAGLKAGDRILKINGRMAVDYDVWELKPILRQEGAAVELLVEQDGVKKRVSLVLHRLL